MAETIDWGSVYQPSTKKAAPTKSAAPVKSTPTPANTIDWGSVYSGKAKTPQQLAAEAHVALHPELHVMNPLNPNNQIKAPLPTQNLFKNFRSSIPENLPFVGPIIRTANSMDQTDWENFDRAKASDYAKFTATATKQTAQAFVSAPVRIAAQARALSTGGKKTSITLPVLGKSEAYSNEVSADVESGIPMWLAVAKQVPNIIFDTLFTVGVAQKAVSPRESTILTSKGGGQPIKSNILGDATMQSRSFRMTKTPAPTYVPITDATADGAWIRSTLKEAGKYNPENPLYLKVEPGTNGVSAKIIQIKSSLLKSVANLFNAEGKAVKPIVGEKIVQGGEIIPPQLQQIVPLTALPIKPSEVPSGAITPSVPNLPSAPTIREQLKLTTTEPTANVPAQVPTIREQLTAPTATVPVSKAKPTQAAKAEPIYTGSKTLTTKILDNLKGRSSVSKQFISDLTNSPDLKQAERDLIRETLKEYGDNIPVKEFADKVQTGLLPLKRTFLTEDDVTHKNIVLPNELRGNVANYSEHIYQSPIKTSAGDIHFSSEDAPNYFSHTRIEDVAKTETRRIIELQSDLFQKGNLERSTTPEKEWLPGEIPEQSDLTSRKQQLKAAKVDRSKLEPYRNTWHERIIREEVKQAAKDGKTKLQFPTGETAMKIEGLGENIQWIEVQKNGNVQSLSLENNPPKVGQLIRDTRTEQEAGNEWIITDVLGDGKFKAVPKNLWESYQIAKKEGRTTGQGERFLSETFDISGKIDTNNPIYKFYEKTVGKYLINHYGATKIKDPQGVEWWQIKVDSALKSKPIGAFSEIPKPPKPTGSTTLQTTIIPGAKEFIEQDVKPGVTAFGRGLIDTLRLARDIVAPRMGATPKSVDAFMEMKGIRDKASYIMQQVLKSSETMFSKLSREQQIEFFDRYKRGQPQLTKEMQAYADFRRAYDKQIYDELIQYKPDLAWKDNHLRVLWTTIPGVPKTFKQAIFGTRRPLRGTMGFMKQSTLPDISSGLAQGGVPFSYNPAIMDNMAWADAIKYISAQRMWNILKETGSREYLAPGKAIPEGKALVNDNIANIYYGGGRWVLDKADARLLNNYLSRDLVRDYPLGRAAFIIKNTYTAVELGLSGFHAMFVSADTVASQFSLGILRIFNLGLKQIASGEVQQGLTEVTKGVKEIITSPYSFVTATKLGSRSIKSIAGKPNVITSKTLEAAKAEFDASDVGQWLKKQQPDYQHLTDLLFTGGLKPRMDEVYRNNSIKSFQDSIYSGNYIGGVIRSPFAINQAVMYPLFEIYIPRIKWGVAMKSLAYELQVNAGRLANGQITEGEIARNVVNRVENRLGEMNFDNLFWNRSFKSGMQLAFRSVTWFGGSVREILGAPYEQGKEFYEAYKEGRSPNLMPKFAYLMALYVVTAVISEVIQYLSTGKHINPLSKDVGFPQIDDQGNRVSVPTYVKDIFAAKQKPGTFLQHKISGFWEKIIEASQNKDFYSNEIYSESDPFWMKFIKSAWHAKPVPFAVQSAQKQETTRGKIESFFGLTKAPTYITNTKLQNEIYDLYNKRFSGGTKSPLETAKSDTSQKYKALVKAGKLQEAAEVKAQAIEDGTFTERGFGRIETNLKLGTDRVLFQRLPQDDKDRLFKKMTPEEKAYFTNIPSSSSERGSRTGGRSGNRGGR